MIGETPSNLHRFRDLKIAHPYRLPMPRFLFELKGAETTAASAEAMEFASLEDARQDALRALCEIARDELPNGHDREFVIQIRDEEDAAPLLRASLSVRVDTLA